MRFELHIGTDNAAFEDGPGPEIARILRELADLVEDDLPPDHVVRLRDVNGNRVGFAVLVSDPPVIDSPERFHLGGGG